MLFAESAEAADCALRWTSVKTLRAAFDARWSCGIGEALDGHYHGETYSAGRRRVRGQVGCQRSNPTDRADLIAPIYSAQKKILGIEFPRPSNIRYIRRRAFVA